MAMNETEFFATVARLLNIPADRVTPHTNLRDLVQDSFALVEVVIELQDTLGVSFTQTDFRDVMTVQDLAILFAQHKAGGDLVSSGRVSSGQ
jgi:acyl carrier protein